ncbi:MAG: hypothetical protein ACPLW7_06475, partial [Minisyncoccia bacterium]
MNLLNKHFWLFLLIFYNCFSLSNDRDSLFVEDENGNIVNFKQIGNKHILICYHYYQCVDCFKIIAKLNEKYRNYNFSVLTRASENNKISKSRMKYDIKKALSRYFKTKFNIYFDIHYGRDPWPPINLKEGIFGKYNI